MSSKGILPGEVRIGPDYEGDRAAIRSRLAAAAEDRRVSLGSDLVLVFETREMVLSALEERLRADRTSDSESVAAAIPGFAHLVARDGELAATLYVDIADPAALADRLVELSGVAATVSVEVAGHRVAASSHDTEEGAGAHHLAFALDDTDRRALLGGAAVEVVVNHPRCSASSTLSADQVRAIAADIRR